MPGLVVFAANDPKTGAAGGKFDLLSSPVHNHAPAVESGFLAEECSAMLKDFSDAVDKAGSPWLTSNKV